MVFGVVFLFRIKNNRRGGFWEASGVGSTAQERAIAGGAQFALVTKELIVRLHDRLIRTRSPICRYPTGEPD
jgi:hypothetical protein